MSGKDEIRKDAEHSGRLDERTLSILVRGVFWFAWLTARYLRSSLLFGESRIRDD